MELIDFKYHDDSNRYLIKANGGLNKQGKMTNIWIVAKELYRFVEVIEP